MANLKASIKDVRKTKKRTARSTARSARVKTYVKKVELAVANNDAKGAQEALNAAKKELHRAASKGNMKLKSASRKISRLNAKVKTIAVLAAKKK